MTQLAPPASLIGASSISNRRLWLLVLGHAVLPIAIPILVMATPFIPYGIWRSTGLFALYQVLLLALWSGFAPQSFSPRSHSRPAVILAPLVDFGAWHGLRRDIVVRGAVP
jgi:hypothetical protein